MGWECVFRDELKDYERIIDETCKKFGFSTNEFRSKKDHVLRAPRDRKTLFIGKKFFTRSKKFEFWRKEDKFSLYGLTPFPEFYKDPDLADKDETTISYEKKKIFLSPFQNEKCYAFPVVFVKANKNPHPLHLITGRPSSAIMGHTSHWSKMLNSVSCDQFCVINPRTAKKLNLKRWGYG